jgi:hypothetical protein
MENLQVACLSLPLPADPAFADRFPQDDPLAAMSL